MFFIKKKLIKVIGKKARKAIKKNGSIDYFSNWSNKQLGKICYITLQVRNGILDEKEALLYCSRWNINFGQARSIDFYIFGISGDRWRSSYNLPKSGSLFTFNMNYQYLGQKQLQWQEQDLDQQDVQELDQKLKQWLESQ
jgi:hypothetical protein